MALSQSADGNFAEFYRDHHGWLSGWLYSKLGCSHQAADFTQDAFIRLLQKCHQQEDALDHIREPKAYLTTIAGRLVHDHFRRASLEKAYLEALTHLPEALVPSPEDLQLVRETLHEIDSLLDRLKPQIREVFLLAQLEGLTYAAIARRLAISERTVKRHMARALTDCILLLN